MNCTQSTSCAKSQKLFTIDAILGSDTGIKLSSVGTGGNRENSGHEIGHDTSYGNEYIHTQSSGLLLDLQQPCLPYQPCSLWNVRPIWYYSTSKSDSLKEKYSHGAAVECDTPLRNSPSLDVDISKQHSNSRRDQSFSKCRSPRIPFSRMQVEVLETKFHTTRYLSSLDVSQLASRLNLTENRVKIWFQNRRARERRDSTEFCKSSTICATDSRINSSGPLNTSAQVYSKCQRSLSDPSLNFENHSFLEQGQLSKAAHQSEYYVVSAINAIPNPDGGLPTDSSGLTRLKLEKAQKRDNSFTKRDNFPTLLLDKDKTNKRC